MRVAWVNPAFSDYRIPVYAALNALLDGKLIVIFSGERVSPGVRRKLEMALGPGAVGLGGEIKLRSTASGEGFANKGINIPYQPGLLRAISASRPEVIVSEGFFQWTPASLWFRLAHRTPLVIAYERTAHTERNAGRLRLGYRQMVTRVTDAIACNGALSKEYCVRTLHMPEDRVVTGAMAADTEALAARCPKRAAMSGGKSPVFLYVGRLIRLKGLRELLRAWQVFSAQERERGSLLLVGEGPERGVLEEMTRDLRLRDVTFAGGVPYESVVEHYAKADVLVMPTLEDNWSLVVPEAMACGLPILCSKFNGCWPELVKQGINGWVFDPTDAREQAELFATVCRESERLGEMGRASRDIVQGFTPAHAARAVLKACEAAVSARRGARGRSFAGGRGGAGGRACSGGF